MRHYHPTNSSDSPEQREVQNLHGYWVPRSHSGNARKLYMYSFETCIEMLAFLPNFPSPFERLLRPPFPFESKGTAYVHTHRTWCTPPAVSQAPNSHVTKSRSLCRCFHFQRYRILCSFFIERRYSFCLVALVTATVLRNVGGFTFFHYKSCYT